MTSSARVLAAVTAFVAAGHSVTQCFKVYHSDVERICNAEQGSGVTLKVDKGGVESWLARNVASPEGVVLLNQLQSGSFADRAVHLRSEAQNQSLAGCPLADAYDALAKDDDFRTAIVSLCAGEATTEDGNVARLDVAAASDADRMSDITAWTSTHLRGKEAQGFVARMAAASVKERSGLLLAEAAKFKIAPCPLATVLGQPPPPTVAREVVALPSFNVTSVEPASAQHSVAEAFSNGAAPQVVNACYGPALVKTPQLGGTIALRLTLDARGRLTKVEEGGSSFGNATVIKCIVNGLSGTTLLAASELGARTPAASFKWSMSLSLTPIRGIPPAGWPNFPFPSASSDGFPVDAGAADAGKKKKGR